MLSKFAANENMATFWRQRMHQRDGANTGQAMQVSRQLFSRWKDKMERLPIKPKRIFGKAMWNLQKTKKKVKKQTSRVSSITPEQGRRAEPFSGDPSCHGVAARCGSFLNRTYPWKTAALERSVRAGCTTTYTTLSCCCPGCHTWTPPQPSTGRELFKCCPTVRGRDGVLSKPNKGPSSLARTT